MGPKELKLPDRHFFKIGEVSRLLELPAHVLRYWEVEFQWVRPEKTASGQRIYSRDDVLLLYLIRELLHSKRYTIEGAVKVLRSVKGDWQEGLRRLTGPQNPEDLEHERTRLEKDREKGRKKNEELAQELAALQEQLKTLKSSYARVNRELLTLRTKTAEHQKMLVQRLEQLQSVARKKRKALSITQ
jgi:DNA-binding transcriptional MerR regulator